MILLNHKEFPLLRAFQAGTLTLLFLTPSMEVRPELKDQVHLLPPVLEVELKLLLDADLECGRERRKIGLKRGISFPCDCKILKCCELLHLQICAFCWKVVFALYVVWVGWGFFFCLFILSFISVTIKKKMKIIFSQWYVTRNCFDKAVGLKCVRKNLWTFNQAHSRGLKYYCVVSKFWKEAKPAHWAYS